MRVALVEVTREEREDEMKKGQTVKIYEDPKTQKRYEGLASLRINLKRTDDHLQAWSVNFDGDEIDQLSSRWVNPVNVVRG